MNSTRLVSIATGALVGGISIGSFVLSYATLRDFALTNGITDELSYIWPLLVDASLIVFSLAVVNATLHSESTKRQWALVTVYTALTITFNIMHANATATARIVAAIAPVSLFFSFEMLMDQLKSAIKRGTIAAGITELNTKLATLTNEVSQAEQTIGSRNATITALNERVAQLREQIADTTPNDTDMSRPNDARQQQIAQRREQVLVLAQSGLSQPEIADTVDVSIATIKRDFKALNGKLKQVQNEQ